MIGKRFERVEQQLSSGQYDIADEAYAIIEGMMLNKALAHTRGHKQEAAKLLGWGRNTVTRKIKELEARGISIETKDSSAAVYRLQRCSKYSTKCPTCTPSTRP